MAEANRNYKDSTFCDLFYNDDVAREHLLELYNGLFDEQFLDPSIIHKARLEDVLFNKYKNDLAFTANDEDLVLIEHQSNPNLNMPCRFTCYYGREQEIFVPQRKIFRSSLQKLLTPFFFVFYIGTTKRPPEETLLLSSAFKGRHSNCVNAQLTVKVININLNVNHPLLLKCPTLLQYSQFIDITRQFIREKYKDIHRGIDRDILTQAVKACIKQGILEEYLTRKGSEVVNMLFGEYDYDMDMQAQREDGIEVGREEGRKDGIEEGRKDGIEEGKALASAKVYYTEMKLPIDVIAQRLGLTEKDVEDLLSKQGLLESA